MRTLVALCLAILAASSCHAIQEFGKGFAVSLDTLTDDGKCEQGKYSVLPDGIPVYSEDECSRVTCDAEDWGLSVDYCWSGDEEGHCFRDVEANGQRYPWCCDKKRVDCHKVEFAFEVDKLSDDGKCERYAESAAPNTTVYDHNECSKASCVGSEGDGWVLSGGRCYRGDESGMCFEDVEPTGNEFPQCCTKKVVKCPDGNWTKKEE